MFIRVANSLEWNNQHSLEKSEQINSSLSQPEIN